MLFIAPSTSGNCFRIASIYLVSGSRFRRLIPGFCWGRFPIRAKFCPGAGANSPKPHLLFQRLVKFQTHASCASRRKGLPSSSIWLFSNRMPTHLQRHAANYSATSSRTAWRTEELALYGYPAFLTVWCEMRAIPMRQSWKQQQIVWPVACRARFFLSAPCFHAGR